VYLLHDIVDGEDGTNKIIKKSTPFTLTSSGKIECYSIVGSYRSLKPATMLAKIAKLNESAKDRLVIVNQKDNHFDNAIEKLKLELPNSVSVERSSEWVRTSNWKNTYTVDIITVKLKDGSYIQYDVNSFSGDISVRKVHDMSVEKLTLKDKEHNLKLRLG
jgi:hypothetical protein